MSDEVFELMMKRPESLEQLVDDISPTIYDNLKLAIELGKWADGARLTGEQVEFCMQAVILYESKNLPEDQRLGFDLPTGCSKQELN